MSSVSVDSAPPPVAVDHFRLVRPLVVLDLTRMSGQTHHPGVRRFIRHAIRAVEADDMERLREALLDMSGWNFYRRAPTVFFQLRTGIDLNLAPNPRAVYSGNGVTLTLDEFDRDVAAIRRRLGTRHVQWPVHDGREEEETYCEYLRRSLSGLIEHEVTQTSHEGRQINQMLRLRLGLAVCLLQDVHYRKFGQVELLLSDVARMGLNVDVEHALVRRIIGEVDTADVAAAYV